MLTWSAMSVLISLTSFQSLTAHVLDCDFEDDTCRWRSIRGLWERASSSRVAVSGPETDHTTGNGFFLRMSSNTQDRQMPSSQVISPLGAPYVNSANGSCLTFWYYMYGYEVHTLTVYKKEREQKKQVLFRVMGNQGKRWFKAVVDTGIGRFSLKIIASYKWGNGYGDIAIDDISFSSEGNCQPQDAQSDRPVLDCNFEEDLCFWASGYRGMLGMRRVTVTPSDTTMTTFHPYNNGSSFLKLEHPHRYQHQSILIAPAIPIGKDGSCMSFWYMLFDPYLGFGQVAVKRNDVGSPFDEMAFEGEILLELRNNEREASRVAADSDFWNFAQVNLPSGNHHFIYFHLLFRRYGDLSSNIKIDDIRLDQDGPCKPVPQETLVNCNFEKDYCRWFSGQQEREQQWIRRKGPTPEAFTGPPGDHTTGAGYYIHFKEQEYSGSIIRTPHFHVSSKGACFTFWYYMYGEDIQSLSLFGHYNTYNRPGSEIWKLDGNQGDQWTQQNISLTIPGEAFLLFSATKGYFPRADIALDDVSISFDGVCENDIISTTTAATTETVNTTTPEKPKKWLPSPVLTIKGDTQPAMVNSRVEIICGDYLDGASYTWLKRDEHEFIQLEGQDNRTLLYEKIRLPDWGTYMCSVAKEGYFDAESKTFDIQVERPVLPSPMVIVVGMANPVYQDSRIELFCQNPDNDTELSYRWQRLQGTTRKDLYEISHLLVFDEIQVGDSANYSCIVRKDGFRSTESENVEILVVSDPRPKPWLDHNIGTLPSEVNKRIQFTCGTRDVERGVFHWKTNSVAFANSPPPNNRILIIEKSDPSYNGNYSCRISKDGYSTAKSRTALLRVAPGKPCESRYSCWGNTHSGKCVDRRCQCAKNSVLRGNSCLERPRAPKIRVFPDFKKFAFGETFYLICKVREPVPKSFTYNFKLSSDVLGRDGEHETYYIHKVANATSRDQGYYTCAVNIDGISSEYSESVYILVKGFVDLNCDFEGQNTCSWLQVDEPQAVNFTMEEEHSTPEEASIAFSNTFLRLPQRKDKMISRSFLRSPELDNTNLDSCLRFRYRMHGPGVYSLAVWRYSSLWKDSPDRHNLWTVIGDQGNEWFTKELTIKSHYNNYLQFEADGDVAIDDIEYKYRGSCLDQHF